MDNICTRRVFVDMDGTLAEWKSAASEADLYKRGYFYNLKPHIKLIELLQKLLLNGTDVYIVSAYLSQQALLEKNAWLNKYVPQIGNSHRIFVPYGKSKSEYVEKHLGCRLNTSFVLLDDHTPNLMDWVKHGGYAVKVMNGINGIGGRWKGSKISAFVPDTCFLR